jgi:hypothetical protein
MYIFLPFSLMLYMLLQSVKDFSLMMAEQFQLKHVGDENSCAVVGN